MTMRMETSMTMMSTRIGSIELLTELCGSNDTLALDIDVACVASLN